METIIIRGSLKLQSWQEGEIENDMSTARVRFELSAEHCFQADAQYSLFYRVKPEGDPHSAHALYTGFLATEVDLEGERVTLVWKEEGEFRHGLASSSLVLLPTLGLEGTGFYRSSANAEESKFELRLESKQGS